MTEIEQESIFHDWLAQYKKLLFKIVNVYADLPEDRSDLFQEVAMQVWQSIPRYRQDAAVSTWIYRVALNTSIKWLKKEKKERHDDAVSVTIPDLPKATDDRLTWLYEEISKLNEIDRSVCLLMLDDFSYREMAGILGISESNVAVKIHRLKKHLIEASKNVKF